MVRHHDGVGAELDRGPGVIGVEDALQDQLARPDLLDPLDVLPGQRRIELVADPFGELVDVVHALHVAGEIAEGLALALEDAPGPGRLGRHVDDVLEADFRRHRHAVLDVAVALAEHLQVDGEHQRVALGRHRARQDVLGEAAVADHVELEPERFAGRLRHVFDRADRHGRERERNAGLVGGAAPTGFRRRRAACRTARSAPARTAPTPSARRWWWRGCAAETSTSTRWRSLIASRSARLARSVSSL